VSEARLEHLEARVGDLVASQTGGVDLAALRDTYKDDPVGFAERVLGARLWSRQREWLLALRDAPQVAIASGHAMSKDFTLAAASLWWTFGRHGLTLVTSRTQRQIVEGFFAEVGRLFRQSQLPGDLYTDRLRAPTGKVLGFTSESASAYSGFHGHHVLVILSEAQEIEPPAWEGLFSCATGQDDRIAAVGNPTLSSGRFAECFRSSAWRTFRVPCTEHPNITGAEPFIPGGPSRAWIEKMRDEWGEGSSIFQSRVNAVFPSEDPEALVRRDWLEVAAARWESGDLLDVSVEPILGLDVAEHGKASTALSVRRGDHLLEVVVWRDLDLMATVARVQVEARRFGVRPSIPAVNGLDARAPRGRLAIDAVGAGAGVASRLAELHYNVRRFLGSERPSDPDRFANVRTESFWHLRVMLEEHRIGLPLLPELADLTRLEWHLNGQGKIALEPKEDFVARVGGRAADVTDSITMCLYTRAAPRLAPLHYSA
jgi:hypothetical protein